MKFNTVLAVGALAATAVAAPIPRYAELYSVSQGSEASVEKGLLKIALNGIN